MILVKGDEILSRFAGIPAVLQTLHKLHPAITCKTFYVKRSVFCTAGIPLCRDKTFSCISSASLGGINRSKIENRSKVNKYLRRISSFYRRRHRRCSAKKVFLKLLQYSQENTCVRVSFRSFNLQFYQKETPKLMFSSEYCVIFKNTFFAEHLQTTVSCFMTMNRHS